MSFFYKAGLEIGEMILAVNKDSLLGSNYDTVSVKTALNVMHTPKADYVVSVSWLAVCGVVFTRRAKKLFAFQLLHSEKHCLMRHDLCSYLEAI